MELDQLMRFARAYQNLGWAIQEQLDSVVQNDSEDINPNAYLGKSADWRTQSIFAIREEAVADYVALEKERLRIAQDALSKIAA